MDWVIMRISHLRFVFSSAVLFWFVNTSLLGNTLSWKSLGPDGVVPVALAEHPVDPNVLWVSSWQGGVFKSTDRGQSWVSCTRGLPVGDFSDYYGQLSIGPKSPYPVFVTVLTYPLWKPVPSVRVWRSLDSGNTWHPLTEGGTQGGTLTPDPHDSLRLYLTRTPSGFYPGTASSLDVTGDGGETWKSIYETEAGLLTVYPHPSRPGLLFMVKHAATSDWLLRSRDGGEKWATIRSFPVPVSGVAFDQSDPDRLYLGSSAGLYVSENTGVIWSPPANQPGNGSISGIHVRRDGSLLAQAGGLYKSSDRGESWCALPAEPEEVREIFPSRHDPRVILATSKARILRTDDEGAQWRTIDRGINTHRIIELAVDALNPGRVYALADWPNRIALAGPRWWGPLLFRSDDYGKSWTRVPCPEGRAFTHLRVDPGHSRSVYLASTENTLWRSTDEGTTWKELQTGIAGLAIVDLLVDPFSKNLLIASPKGIYRSTDRGETWSKTADLALEHLTFVKGSTVIGGSHDGAYKSVDEGKSWNKVWSGLVRAIAVDPQDPSTAYAASESVFKTTDGGQTWHPVSLGAAFFNTLAVSGDLVIAGAINGVLISHDAGATWEPSSEGLEPALITALAVDRNKPAAVYLGTVANGLYSLVSKPEDRFTFPVLAESDQTSTGLALANAQGSPVTFELTAHAWDGSAWRSVPDPDHRALEGFEQLALTGGELFDLTPSSSASGGGWFQMETTADLAPVFVLVGNNQADGSCPVSRLSRTLYFTRIYQGKSAFKGAEAVTTLHIVNPNDRPLDVQASLIGSGGDDLAPARSYRIESQGAFSANIGTMFGTDLVVQNGIVRVDVRSHDGLPGISGFELIVLPEAKTSVALTAHASLILDSAYSAQLSAVPGAMTNLKLVNVTNQNRTVRLEATDDEGRPLAPPVVLDIPAGTSIERDVSELFAFGTEPTVGSLKLTPDGAGLLGDVLFGDFVHLERASALLLETMLSSRMVFAQVANGMGYYSGLAVFNPGQLPADVTVQVFTPEGKRTGETSLKLAPGGRVSRLLTEIVPATAGQVGGYMIVESNQPIVAQELFANEKLLAAVPASVRR
ncbi:MAG: hypothetical protein EHM61_04855 [Acidobacteria bacterium]|nr:MAG: hypothetical protein EHM61_04855 [Acidobacteriota bacterium]